MLPIGQLPDAANAKAAAANAITLVRRCSAPVPQLAASSRWCSLLLGIGDLLGSFFPMVPCGGPATMRRCHLHLCHGTPAILPRRFGQQQTSFGAPGQSLRYCALASLSATAPRPATFSRWRSATAAPLTRCFATALPARRQPHPAEKSTPVWLAIWHIWAGFANSQHRDAAFATPNNMCAHSSLLQQ